MGTASRACAACNTPVPDDAAVCPTCSEATPTDPNGGSGEGFEDQLKAAFSDRYRIEKELGRGGMAVVFLARDLQHDRAVALKKAEALHQRALAIREQAFGPTHPRVGETLDNLGKITLEQGNYRESERYFQRAVDIHEAALGPDHPRLAQTLENYARLLRRMDQTPKADSLEARARAIKDKRDRG